VRLRRLDWWMDSSSSVSSGRSSRSVSACGRVVSRSSSVFSDCGGAERFESVVLCSGGKVGLRNCPMDRSIPTVREEESSLRLPFRSSTFQYRTPFTTVQVERWRAMSPTLQNDVDRPSMCTTPCNDTIITNNAALSANDDDDNDDDDDDDVTRGREELHRYHIILSILYRQNSSPRPTSPIHVSVSVSCSISMDGFRISDRQSTLSL